MSYEMYHENKLLWNVREAAMSLGLSPWTIRLYIRQRKLQPVRIGRRVLLEPDECRRFLEGCKSRKALNGAGLRPARQPVDTSEPR